MAIGEPVVPTGGTRPSQPLGDKRLSSDKKTAREKNSALDSHLSSSLTFGFSCLTIIINSSFLLNNM